MKTTEPINLLLIEDEAFDVRRVRNTLQPFAERLRLVDVVSDGREAVELIERNRGTYDVVIMDFQIPGALIGENLIRRIKEIEPALQIIVMTKMTINVTDFIFASKLLEAGAMWYCTKYPGDIEAFIYQPTDFVLNIINAYEKKRLLLKQQLSVKRWQDNVQEILNRKRLIGESPAMQWLREHLQRFASTNATILIQGASGTGKELVAMHIHYASKRKFENFLPINCGSLPDHLIESELFGFAKGAFTGASAEKKGLFEVADGGTIFLDEITELPPPAQVKLLRVIQEGEIDKIGRTSNIKVNVRVIAATNKDLQTEVRERRFREDLFYRLNVVTVNVPPLVQRREDIPLLSDYFMQIFSAEMNLAPPLISEEARQILMEYAWPGNVRELQNVVQRLLFSRSEVITVTQVKMALGLQSDLPVSSQRGWWSKDRILPWHDMEKQLQEQYFRFVREQASSDAEAARLLGLAPPNYYRMCKRLGIK
ncbi:MAG: Transcriptional regulatory protein ZraR [bacterium]|nr:Transcriptional regulatory protein ZraR [bacterium]